MSVLAKNKILVLGGAAHANRGDLAMQAGIVQWLRGRVPDADLVFFSSAPERVSEQMGARCLLSPDGDLVTPWTRETPKSSSQRRLAIKRGRRFVWRARLFRWFGRCPGDNQFFRELAQARCVLVPGSGSMNSLWWHDWLYPKAFTVLAARAMGVPVVMTSQGVGPEFSHPLDARVAGEMFSACGIVGVRDADQSGELLRAIGVPDQLVRHTGDDALLFESEPAELPKFPQHKTLVGVNLRDSSTYQKGFAKARPAEYAAWLDGIAALHDVHFVFIPVSYDGQDDDRASARAVVAEMAAKERSTVVEAEFDAFGIRELCATMDLALGISYHFLLFSLAAGVPSLLLFQNAYYRQKSSGLARLYGVSEQCVDVEAGLGGFDELVARADGLRSHLRARQVELQARGGATREEIVARFMDW